MKSRILLATVAAVLTACGGGGGGGGSSTPPTPPAPIPSATISLSEVKVAAGTPVTVTWSSTNTTSCNAAGNLQGPIQTSGTQVVMPTEGGQFTYTITCTGAGGSATQSATLAVPIAVKRSSYENFKETGLGAQSMPTSEKFRTREAVTAGHAYGDFFQEGQLSMIAATNVFPETGAQYGSTTVGKLFFFKKVNGSWVDRTSDILVDQTGCISPRKVIVADFNADKKPDVFVSCTGIEGTIQPGQQEGEYSRYLLSQPDGKYVNKQLQYWGYLHGAAAYDFDNSGYADIVVADPLTQKTVYMLVNDKNGGFTADFSKMPQEVQASNGFPESIYTVEIVDVDGDAQPDLFLAGAEKNLTQTLVDSTWFAPSFFKGGANKTFFNKIGEVAPNATLSVTIDILVKNGKVALLRANTDYSKLSIQVLTFPGLQQESLTEIPAKDTVWMVNKDGKITGAFASNNYSFTW